MKNDGWSVSCLSQVQSKARSEIGLQLMLSDVWEGKAGEAGKGGMKLCVFKGLR